MSKRIAYLQGKLEPVLGGKIVQLAMDKDDEFFWHRCQNAERQATCHMAALG